MSHFGAHLDQFCLEDLTGWTQTQLGLKVQRLLGYTHTLQRISCVCAPASALCPAPKSTLFPAQALNKL